MSTDLQPLEAPTLESSAAPAAAPSEGLTLTVPQRTGRGAILGLLMVRESSAKGGGTEHLRVPMPVHAPLNLTA